MEAAIDRIMETYDLLLNPTAARAPIPGRRRPTM